MPDYLRTASRTDKFEWATQRASKSRLTYFSSFVIRYQMKATPLHFPQIWRTKGSKSTLLSYKIYDFWFLKKIKSSWKQLVTYTCSSLINKWQTDSIGRIYSTSVVDVFRIVHDFYIQPYLSLEQRNNEIFMLNEQKWLLTFYILKGIWSSLKRIILM